MAQKWNVGDPLSEMCDKWFDDEVMEAYGMKRFLKTGSLFELKNRVAEFVAAEVKKAKAEGREHVNEA